MGFIVLNTQLYKDGQDVPGHVEQQSKWLTQELLKSKCLMGTEEYERLIIFSHISPFIEDANEEDGYFNLEKNIRLKLLNDISNAKGTHWFCGHYHRNAGGIYTNPENGAQLECVTSSAVGTTLITNKTGNKLDLNDMGSVELNE